MRILTRYILREVTSHALVGVAIFTFVIFMRDLARILEIVVRASAPLPSVAELFFLTLPTAFTVTMPMAVLVGILIGLSRLAADSEVTAMRAIGLGSGTFLRVIADCATFDGKQLVGVVSGDYFAESKRGPEIVSRTAASRRFNVRVAVSCAVSPAAMLTRCCWDGSGESRRWECMAGRTS